VYTRKSSEEGLEQDFNSLQAQREACEAYILSQRHEGWRVLSQAYDDGGYSGGSMDRPGLKQLLSDIASGQVDVVVVYKVDRLTRSLTDFARIVDVFDQRGVSFVSVTQSFNTTSSMGRLTLNVLLSFAQFEREVTGERIRDKIAASKKKGLWMGGFVPIGYEANGRTLTVNEAEAETVRTIYRLYLELRSVDALKAELDRQGIHTKVRPGRGGAMSGGGPFSRAHLYRLLSNPLYAGEIAHKGQRYPGQHPAIIDEATWEAVQAVLAQNSHRHLVKAHAKNPSLLAGLLVDASGERLVPTHATKLGRRYRYYVSSSLLKSRLKEARSPENTSAVPTWRLAAVEIEAVVVQMLTRALSSRDWCLAHAPDAQHLSEQREVMERAERYRAVLAGDEPLARRGLILEFLEEVVLEEDGVALKLRAPALMLRRFDAITHPPAQLTEPVKLCETVALHRRGTETRLVIESESAPERTPDPALVRALAQAHRWWRDLLEMRFVSLRELAQAYGTDERYVARIVPMAFLSGPLTAAILDGAQPPEFTLHRFLHK
jgi:DNA invertase Pin-like site-specific DNA recombinase